jgi:hypothetical protein
MSLHYSLFVMITLTSAVVFSVILMLLHLLKKFLTRKVFFVVVAVISIISCVIIGSYDKLSWYKILAETVVITTVMIVAFVIAVYSFEWIDKEIKDSLKNNKSEK